MNTKSHNTDFTTAKQRTDLVALQRPRDADTVHRISDVCVRGTASGSLKQQEE